MENILKPISLVVGLFLGVCAILYQAVKSSEEISDMPENDPCEDDE